MFRVHSTTARCTKCETAQTVEACCTAGEVTLTPESCGKCGAKLYLPARREDAIFREQLSVEQGV